MFVYRVGAGRCRQPYGNDSHRGTDQDFLNHFGFVDKVAHASLYVGGYGDAGQPAMAHDAASAVDIEYFLRESAANTKNNL
jgi:hypothetical protein